MLEVKSCNKPQLCDGIRTYLMCLLGKANGNEMLQRLIKVDGVQFLRLPRTCEQALPLDIGLRTDVMIRAMMVSRSAPQVFRCELRWASISGQI